jgi:MoaA/NifB/PqqE/SkfB family radical SAM enzyme
MVEWFPAFRCNSKCRYCGGYDAEARAKFKDTVPLADILRIIDMSARKGTKMWNIGGRGGEPLLYPGLMEALAAIKRHKMSGLLITNGLLLNEENVSRLVEIKWDMLRISLDSHLGNIHDGIRGIPGNFETIDKALILLKELKKKKRQASPVIVACPVISNLNYNDLERYFDYCAERGVDEVQLMPLIEVHDKAKELMLSPQQRQDLKNILERKKGESRFRHNMEFMLKLCDEAPAAEGSKTAASPVPSGLYCIHLWKTLVISEDGYLSPCSLIKDKLMPIGGDMLKAWDSGIMNDLRARVLKGDYINAACQECCGPLRNETQDFNTYLCKKNKL